MALQRQVLCVDKSDKTNSYERITHIGGQDANGSRWHISQQEAIEGIESGKWQFYVNQGGYQSDVIVAQHLGHKYLKTWADGVQPNNLLSLSACRSSV